MKSYLKMTSKNYILLTIIVVSSLLLVKATRDIDETLDIQDEYTTEKHILESVSLSAERTVTLADDMTHVLKNKNINLLESFKYFQAEGNKPIKEFPEIQRNLITAIKLLEDEYDRLVSLELEQLTNVEGIAEENVEAITYAPTVEYADLFNNVATYDFTYKDGTFERTLLIEVAPTTILLSIRWKEGRFDGISVTKN